MSRLEMQAQPFLQPLLAGDRCGMDLASQSIIALWAVKTAMVLEALDAHELRAYTPQERARLKSFGAIPERTSVWIAASTDPALFMSAKISHRATINSNAITGLNTTIGLSRLVLQVFTVRVPASVTATSTVTAEVRKGPWRDATRRIWPADSGNAAIWPPGHVLDGAGGIARFTERFITSDIAPSDLDIVAI